MKALLVVSLCWAWPHEVVGVAGRLPAETIKKAEAFFAKRGLQEIQQAAADEERKQVNHLQEPLPLAQKELQGVIDSSLSQTQKEKDVLVNAERDKIALMNKGISQGLERVLPEATETAKAFAKSRALLDTAQALKPHLLTIVQEEGVAEDERQDAALTIQAALATSSEMQELAHEAKDLANYLNAAHAQDHAQAANQRNKLAEAQAQQSLRIARTSGTMVYDSVALANSALARAEKAEQQAAQAVENARRNTWSLQKLKIRAQQALEQVQRTALAQKGTHGV